MKTTPISGPCIERCEPEEPIRYNVAGTNSFLEAMDRLGRVRRGEAPVIAGCCRVASRLADAGQPLVPHVLDVQGDAADLDYRDEYADDPPDDCDDCAREHAEEGQSAPPVPVAALVGVTVWCPVCAGCSLVRVVAHLRMDTTIRCVACDVAILVLVAVGGTA